jgi:hypothetical protein
MTSVIGTIGCSLSATPAGGIWAGAALRTRPGRARPFSLPSTEDMFHAGRTTSSTQIQKPMLFSRPGLPASRGGTSKLTIRRPSPFACGTRGPHFTTSPPPKRRAPRPGLRIGALAEPASSSVAPRCPKEILYDLLIMQTRRVVHARRESLSSVGIASAMRIEAAAQHHDVQTPSRKESQNDCQTRGNPRRAQSANSLASRRCTIHRPEAIG